MCRRTARDIEKLNIDLSRLNYMSDYHLQLPLRPDMKHDASQGSDNLFPTLAVWFCPVCAHMLFPVSMVSTGRDGRV